MFNWFCYRCERNWFKHLKQMSLDKSPDLFLLELVSGSNHWKEILWLSMIFVTRIFFSMLCLINFVLNWRFVTDFITNSILGKKLLGNCRFPPLFFAADFLFEVVLCKSRLNNINFCMLFLLEMKNFLLFFIILIRRRLQT